MPLSPTDVRVLVIIPNLGMGGAQKVFRDQLQFLSRHFQIMGCTFNWDGAFEEDKNLNIVSLEVPAGVNLIYKCYFFLLRIIRLKKLKTKFKPDVTISHLEGADYVNILAKRTDKTICWIHGSKRYDQNIEGWYGKIRFNLMMPWLYRKAEKIVTVSKGIEQELVQNLQIKPSMIQTIYNGIDIKKIIIDSEIPVSELALINNNKIIVTHCRLSRQKNLKALLTIFKHLPTAGYKLIIIGDGEMRDELLAYCAALDLKTWSVWSDLEFTSDYLVHFFGQQTNPFKYLKNASVYAMTSMWEGFPLALCEAIACGLPVICSDCFTGPREIMKPELPAAQPVQEPYYTTLGVLMPVPDVDKNNVLEEWAGEINKMLTVQNSIDQFAAKERIAEFDITRSQMETLQLIEGMVHE